MLLFVSVIAACSSASKDEAVEKKTQRPIMIQGPMPIEAENFAKMLKKKNQGILYFTLEL
jgi:adenosylhomocysteine nucleosidase